MPKDLPKVLLTPHNEENPYLVNLRQSLCDLDVETDWFYLGRTRSQTLNALLAPMSLWGRRRHGFNVLHIHWTYEFGWPAIDSIPILRRLPRIWFQGFLIFARLIGFALVFTWHDVLPLNSAFDDESKSRSMMAKRLDRIITITNAAKKEIVSRWDVDDDIVDVIPEGPPLILHTLPRNEARHLLRVEDSVLISAFGHIDRYKGIDLLLQAATLMTGEANFSIRILGVAVDPEYALELTGLVARLQGQGRDVSWTNRTFSNEELGTLLSATDIVAIPFRRITNSTTMRFGMASGAVVILPRLEALTELPEDAVERFEPDSVESLKQVLDKLLLTWPKGVEQRRAAAQLWVSDWSWSRVGDATLRTYNLSLERCQI